MQILVLSKASRNDTISIFMILLVSLSTIFFLELCRIVSILIQYPNIDTRGALGNNFFREFRVPRPFHLKKAARFGTGPSGIFPIFWKLKYWYSRIRWLVSKYTKYHINPRDKVKLMHDSPYDCIKSISNTFFQYRSYAQVGNKLRPTYSITVSKECK